MDFKKTLQSFDWRSLQVLTNPKAADDLNNFLEKLPQNTSNVLLAVAGVVWLAAAGAGLFATIQLQTLTELRAELQEVQALKPSVPVIKDVAVNKIDVDKFVKKATETYTGLAIKGRGASIEIKGQSTMLFGQFREAVGHIQNGGSGWRVDIENLCVGRECKQKPLVANLKINKVSVNIPN